MDDAATLGDEIMAELTRQLSNVMTAHDFSFYFYFPNDVSAERTAAELLARGFEVRVEPAPTGEGSVLCLASKVLVPNGEQLNEYGRLFDSLAKQYGGEFDGWDSSIVPPEQKITALNEVDKDRLCEQRAVVEHQLGDPDSKRKFKTAAGKLGTIRAIIQAGTFKAGQTYELQCLGVVLGDAFVQELGMEWVMVEDSYGRDPAIRMPGTSIILYPLTMISKRIERGEEVDVFELFNGITARIEEISEEGLR